MIEQKEILKKSKKFIKNGHFKNRNVSYNPNYCLCSWAESIGYLNIKEFSEKKISLINRYKIIFKEFFSIHRDNLECKNSKNTTKYQNLVMSYFFPENLRKNGSYYDKYFSLNTDSDKKSIWVLIPLKKSNLRYKTKKKYYNFTEKKYKFL